MIWRNSFRGPTIRRRRILVGQVLCHQGAIYDDGAAALPHLSLGEEATALQPDAEGIEVATGNRAEVDVRCLTRLLKPPLEQQSVSGVAGERQSVHCACGFSARKRFET